MTFEFDSAKYAAASTHQKEWGARLVAELKLKGHERILDLGCGEGAITAELSRLVPRGLVLGIDASEDMIAAARKRTAPNLRFELLDINTMEPDGQFDLVFSNATLHWVKDHRRLLQCTLRLLSPSGVARFNFAGEGNCAAFLRIVRQVMARREFAPAFRSFTWPWYMPSVDEYRALASELPFRSARVWGEIADRFFADADAITRWIDQPSLVPFLAHLDEEARQPFRDAVVERMLRATGQADGRHFETFRRINLLATK